jgi:hypothetical protein
MRIGINKLRKKLRKDERWPAAVVSFNPLLSHSHQENILKPLTQPLVLECDDLSTEKFCGNNFLLLYCYGKKQSHLCQYVSIR